jgi:hypothetical protein
MKGREGYLTIGGVGAPGKKSKRMWTILQENKLVFYRKPMVWTFWVAVCVYVCMYVCMCVCVCVCVCVCGPNMRECACIYIFLFLLD